MGRRALCRIGGDDFDILIGPKAQQHIMRTNARMRTAKNRACAQMAFQPGCARFQRCGANNEVINLSHITPKPAPVSGAANDFLPNRVSALQCCHPMAFTY